MTEPLVEGHWGRGPLLAVDFETTGVDALTCRPVTVACVLQRGDGSIEKTHEQVLDCGVDVPEEAAKIHGYTTDRVRAEGKDPHKVMQGVKLMLNEAWRADTPVVMYNAPFDWTLILAELERRPEIGPPPAVNIIDPLLIDRTLWKYRKGKRKLVMVATHYGVKLANAHDATADCMAALGIARAQALKFEDLRRIPDASDLMAMQPQWHDDWRRGWNEWAERKAPDKVIPDTDTWPARTTS